MIGNMAESEKLLVSNALCFIVNKFKVIAATHLKLLLSDFYKAEELSTAKDLLLGEIDTLKLANFPKISRRRRDSNGKPVLDIDDILTALTFLDGNNLLKKLTTFVATNPDKMPSPRLVEGDLSILWSKLASLEEHVINNANRMTSHFNEIMKINKDSICKLASEIHDFRTSNALAAINSNVCSVSKS